MTPLGWPALVRGLGQPRAWEMQPANQARGKRGGKGTAGEKAQKDCWRAVGSARWWGVTHPRPAVSFAKGPWHWALPDRGRFGEKGAVRPLGGRAQAHAPPTPREPRMRRAPPWGGVAGPETRTNEDVRVGGNA